MNKHTKREIITEGQCSCEHGYRLYSEDRQDGIIAEGVEFVGSIPIMLSCSNCGDYMILPPSVGEKIFRFYTESDESVNEFTTNQIDSFYMACIDEVLKALSSMNQGAK